MNTVLVIDDEEKLRGLLARIIRAEGFEVLEAADCRSGLRLADQHEPDAVLCDVKLPDGTGLELVAKIKAQKPLVEVILLTAYGNIADGVKAIQAGAFDYIVKGDDNDRIIPLLYRAIDKAQLQKQVRDLEKRVGEKFSFDTILGKSGAMRQAVELAKKVAPNDTSVLLTGETGTGKEVFAQAIHQAGPRAGKAFVALNCSTFGKEILESELFGHKQGAFTGAVKDQKGLVAEADGGTLFLDEIGEMPVELQAKLLRVLETNTYIRLGDTKPSVSRFRLIAATNRDLKAAAEAHLFRSDLYFRLNVFEIHLPPLRERVKDIAALVQYYTARFCAKTNKKISGTDPEFLERLERYDWPGNIRELKNIIERCVILADGPSLTPDLLPVEIQYAGTQPHASSFSLAQAERLHIQKVFRHTGGNKAETARLLEIGIATLYRKLEEYKI